MSKHSDELRRYADRRDHILRDPLDLAALRAADVLDECEKALTNADAVIDVSLSYYGSDAAVAAMREVRATLAKLRGE